MPEWELRNGIGWAPDAEHRGYRPPTPPEPFAAPPVRSGAVRAEGTVLEQAHAAMVHARNEFQKHINLTNESRHHYTEEGYRDQISRFQQTDAAKGVDRALESVRARRDQAQAQVDKIRRNLTQPGEAAQESRNSRYWARTKAVLDTLNPGQLHAAAEELLAKAERSELSVLAEELTPYIKARGGVSEIVDKRTGAKQELIDIALTRHVPEYAAAKKQLAKAGNALQFVEANAQFLHRGFADGRPPGVLSDPFSDRLGNRGKYDPDA